MFLEKNQIEELINYSLKNGADFVEIYNSYKIKNTIVITNQKKEKNIIENGLSIRLFVNSESYLISTNNFDIVSIKKNIKNKLSQKSLARKKKNEFMLGDLVINGQDLLPDDFNVVFIKQNIDNFVKTKNDITNVTLSLLTEKNTVFIANSLGKYLKKIEYHYKLDIVMNVKINDTVKFNYYSNGVSTYKNSLNEIEVFDVLKNLYNRIKKIDNVEIKYGYLPVVLSNGIGGVIIHESCGHSLESREILIGKSILYNINKINNNKLTLIDNPNIESLFGSYTYDDEGNIATKKELISKGIINNYLYDNFSSLLLNKNTNSSGRKEGYLNDISSRMSNTYIENGDSDINDIISTIKYGIYVKNIIGGVVDTISGNFSFNALESYRIIDRKIDYSVCIDNLTILGNTVDLLNDISMIGNDLAFSCGICGSESGLIYTTVGQPTIKIDKLFVEGN